MLVCIEKSTGKLIEMQSEARDGTLIMNAINMGYSNDDIEEKQMSNSEFKALLKSQTKPYSGKDFIVSILSDKDTKEIAGDPYYGSISECLKQANFELLSDIIDMAVIDEKSKLNGSFKNKVKSKLLSEEGVDVWKV